MSDRKRTLPPPARRERDVGGFAVKPGDEIAAVPESSGVVDIREPAASADSAMPANGVPAEATDTSGEEAPEAKPARSKTARSRRPKQKPQATSREKELRRRLIASLTPPTKERLNERARTNQATFADVLIEAWLNHGDALERENKPDEQLQRREKLGVRRPQRHKRPPGRLDVQFYLTDRELGIIDKGVDAAGYENRSAYVEELLIRELGTVDRIADAASQ